MKREHVQIGVMGSVAAAAVVLLVAVRRRTKKEKADDAAGGALISSRGKRMNMPALPYLGGVIEGFMNPYDAKSGEGVILMAVAENKLCWDMLKPRIESSLSDLPEWVLGYGPMEGQDTLRESLAAFMRKYLLRLDDSASYPPSEPPYPAASELICATGLSAIISNLFFCICEAGDAVLIPSPYYSAFDSDLRSFCDLHREPVPLNQPAPSWSSSPGANEARHQPFKLTEEALDNAWASATAACRKNGRGGRVRALLLTNPHNPLGRAMGESEMRMAMAWCDARDVHLVCDEIYALSRFGHLLTVGAPPGGAAAPGGSPEEEEEYRSLGSLCEGKLGPKRHVLWGLSKDFGVSGMRVGVLWSQNAALLSAMGTAAVMTSVPGPVQKMVADVAADDAFLSAYLDANSRRLAGSCDVAMKALNELGLSYFRPDYGMFIWIDLSTLLPLVLRAELRAQGRAHEAETIDRSGAGVPAAELFRAEALLYDRLRTELGVVITPGDSQHSIAPGWFRICFAFVPKAVLATALEKLRCWIATLVTSEGASQVAAAAL